MPEIPIKLVEGKPAENSERILESAYERQLLVAEKKPYLSSHRHSVGAFMATASGHHILDACSQIASLGLGYNAGPLFGVAHLLESWLNRSDTENFAKLRNAHESFLQRKLGWNKLHAFIANSGAESNEVALGQCYRFRQSSSREKVLAFEGSFHGRMLVSLSATWNQKKREPFAMPGIESVFIEPAVMTHGPDQEPQIPDSWCGAWEKAAKGDFETAVKEFAGFDSQIDAEIKSLLAVRAQLQSDEIYAVIVEPKQCEGGENYLSARFHNGLLNLAHAYGVPLIYDEVQNGFALGGNFFWHKQFELRDGEGREIYPDYVVCAKKSQTGLVLAHQPFDLQEQFSVASLHRGYIQGMVLDQYEARIDSIGEICAKKLVELESKFSHLIENPRAQGLAFAFDFKDPSHLADFIKIRFEHGMLLYGAGDRTARFRLNLAFRPALIDFLFASIEQMLGRLMEPEAEFKALEWVSERISPDSQYAFHEQILGLKLDLLSGGEAAERDIQAVLDKVLSHYLGDDAKNVSITFIDSDNYSNYRDRIIELEETVYEPQRRTDIEEFDVAIEAPRGVALAVEFKGETVGVAFGAPLKRYPYHRGVRLDPEFENERAVYMIAVTVANEYQGMSLGRVLKYAFSLLALRNEVQFIEGRTRDRMARGMLSINLALGAYEILHMDEEYQDDEAYRDIIYYSIPLAWSEPPCNLSGALDSPLSYQQINKDYFSKNLPALVNKVSLGNFINEAWKSNLEGLADLLPESLRHFYATSGQSECCEKIVKALWRTKSPRSKLLSFSGMHFGHGSFLSRALSGKQESHYFDVDILDCPGLKSDGSISAASKAEEDEILKQVERVLGEEHLAVFVEPVLQNSMHKLSEEFLISLKKLCKRAGAAFIVNDSASMFGRFSRSHFMASGSLEPDGGFSFLGGQMGIVYINKELFVSDPLLLISTWDGDEFSLATFTKALEAFQADENNFYKKRDLFQESLVSLLQDYGVSDVKLEDGFGSFRGNIPRKLRESLRLVSGRYVVAPADSELETAIKFLRSV